MTSTAPTEPNYGIVLPNWIVGADTEQLVEFAVAAEATGWDGVLLADHLVFPHEDYDGPDSMDFHDPWITMAGIATRTDEITLASWITPVPRRQPWQLARDLATLDRLSDGRVILGTGLGHAPTNYTPFGRTGDERVLGRRYDEGLDVIDGLWSGEPFSYDGDHFTIDEATMFPTPIRKPRIPIVTGGFWPNRKPIQRGARWDGIAPLSPGIRGVKDTGTRGNDVPDSVETELRRLVDYYHKVADEPGMCSFPLFSRRAVRYRGPLRGPRGNVGAHHDLG
jgi:alkanesulfonate monooxygenase SsuD/methylene tetrahydromethanopterin reductase-like flavin-dependent oxidoreductase (luciferase family)